jgi:hypothetical protein
MKIDSMPHDQLPYSFEAGLISQFKIIKNRNNFILEEYSNSSPIVDDYIKNSSITDSSTSSVKILDWNNKIE